MLYPDNNIVASSNINNDICNSEDWLSSKKLFDVDAGNRIVNLLWSEKKMEAVRLLIDSPQNTVFLTVPSSTSKNILPVCLASKLADETGAKYELGDDHFFALHKQEVKQLSRVNRIFFERRYKPINTKVLSETLFNKRVLVVDDILTTGGSVKYFINALDMSGVKTYSVIALMGERRLNIDERTKERLSNSFESSNIKLDANKISKYLTRTEAGYIIMAANSARSENAKERLTGNLQRLLDRGIIKNMERHKHAQGLDSTGGSNPGNERVSERSQSWNSRGEFQEEKKYLIKIDDLKKEIQKNNSYKFNNSKNMTGRIVKIELDSGKKYAKIVNELSREFSLVPWKDSYERMRSVKLSFDSGMPRVVKLQRCIGL